MTWLQELRAKLKAVEAELANPRLIPAARKTLERRAELLRVEIDAFEHPTAEDKCDVVAPKSTTHRDEGGAA